MQAPQMKPVRVVLAAGGTGGHVYPALAVAEELRRLRPNARLLFIGGDRMEAQVVPAAGYRFRRISVHGLAGRGLTRLARRTRAALELLLGIPLWQSLGALRGFRPNVVIGTGGYASGPVLLAAHLMHIPSLALEGNRTAGRTSRAAAKMVDVMAVAWPELEAYFSDRVRKSTRVVLTGLPVRPELLQVGRSEGATTLGLDPVRRTLLVLGGSLGSRPINEALVGAIRLIAGRGGFGEVQVVHATGRSAAAARSARADRGRGHGDSAQSVVRLTASEVEAIAPGYRAIPYLEADYGAALAVADLVVARAGASTVAELTARGLPAILIPWSQAAAGEQTENAEPVAKVGGATVIPDAELTPERLAQALVQILWDDERRARMATASKLLGRPKAAEEVARLALELGER